MKKKLINKLVIASNNKDKVKEIEGYLNKINIETIPSYKLKVPEPRETERSFKGNALLKASHTANITKLPSLGDDTGLEVDALNGAPGIFSARYAGEKCSYSDNVNKLLKEMENRQEILYMYQI